MTRSEEQSRKSWESRLGGEGGQRHEQGGQRQGQIRYSGEDAGPREGVWGLGGGNRERGGQVWDTFRGIEPREG